MNTSEIQTIDIQSLLANLPAHGVLWVAYSGGADSTALLHLLCQQLRNFPALVKAVHVDHQLHPDSRLWVEHCQKVCNAMAIELQVIKVDATPPVGESPEAYARQLRYQSICRLMQNDDVLFTAHHMEDQAETLLLQLLRGAGPQGLASMPEIRRLPPGWLVRPLIPFSKNQLRQYNLEHRLEWIEDDSNRQTGMDRNYLRHIVMPALLSRWPGAMDTLSRSARHLAEVMQVNQDMAETDAAKVLSDSDTHILYLPALESLSIPRQKNLLRYWIKSNGFPLPGSHVVNSILTEVIMARKDATPRLQWNGTEIRRFRDRLYLMDKLPDFDNSIQLQWDLEQPHRLEHGQLVAERKTGIGISDNKLKSRIVNIAFRQGGEIIRLPGRKHTQSLKKLFQQADIPTWQRHRLPLIYINGKLAAVANYWVAGDFEAGPDEPGWVITFNPH